MKEEISTWKAIRYLDLQDHVQDHVHRSFLTLIPKKPPLGHLLSAFNDSSVKSPSVVGMIPKAWLRYDSHEWG
jgi:hypothetical protein